MDVRLDENSVRLLASVDGFGIFETVAPHRSRAPLLLRAADFGSGAAAPGALMTIVGTGVTGVTANSRSAVVLSSSAVEAQIQVPYEAAGASLNVTAQRTGASALSFGVPLFDTAPAVLIDDEGFPVLVDADSGMQIDALNPMRPGAHLQILTTGLGRVKPDWPSGVPGPTDHPPEVAATARVLIDGTPVKVTRAVLAPGYVGFYLVEFDAPEFLNAGVAEVTVEAGSQSSNPVRVFTASQ
jgi:uncharacterized protein (TIGR03437 family)